MRTMCDPAAGADPPRVVYRGRLLRLHLRPTPQGVREVVEHPGAVALLVRDGGGGVLLVRQYREGAGADLWEIPAGTLEPEETPFACAQRELREEVGLAGKPRFLGVIYPSPGYATERIFLFELVDPKAAPRAQNEIDEVRFFAPAEILALARQGKGDGKTLAALAFLLARERT